MGKKVLILGGGISGLSLAWKLAQKNIDVEVIESMSPAVGGLAATVRMSQYSLDFGPHFFLSPCPELIEMIEELIEEKMRSFKRSAMLYFHGRFYNYPLTAKNILLQMPISDTVLIAISYFGRQIFNWVSQNKDNDPTFEDWAKNNFGDHLYKLFFKPYTEQFWGIPCPDLSPDSMPTNTKLSFFKTLELLFVRGRIKTNLSMVERETNLTLRYPRTGIGKIPEAMAKKVESSNGKVTLGCTVTKVSKGDKGSFLVQAYKDGESNVFKGDFLVSTIPLVDFIRMLNPVPPSCVLASAFKLKFLSLIVMYLVADKQSILTSSYLYCLGRPYNRIADMNKFCPELSPPNENMLAVEISCDKEDPVWTSSDDDIFEMCIDYLEKDNVLKRSQVKKVFVLRAPNAYPIYRHGYKIHLERILNYISQIENLEVVGRSGRYMYMDMDLCMEHAFNLADKISGKLAI